MTPTEKLTAFAQTLIKLNFRNHELYDTFLTEWEFKIDCKNKIVEGLYLFDKDQNVIVSQEFSEDSKKKYFNYFKSIGIIT